MLLRSESRLEAEFPDFFTVPLPDEGPIKLLSYFRQRELWYNLHLIKGKYVAKKMAYDTQLDWINKMFTEANIRRAGRWNNDALINCYLTHLPRKFMRSMAGFSPKREGEEEEEEEKEATADRQDLMAQGFLHDYLAFAKDVELSLLDVEEPKEVNDWGTEMREQLNGIALRLRDLLEGRISLTLHLTRHVTTAVSSSATPASAATVARCCMGGGRLSFKRSGDGRLGVSTRAPQ
ncbi:hypothetical protein K469DRAFT_702412 [Zopfia rhizophila CBS 207.26]|uniref:Uncharacterized protein n=1 Tax=Zopfia rhizophila CBS 207.26 TaxID=1314779 RepID=A0A6A6D888_9PEZI|nr:hypothetical protein K469DRAFT_703983 [Zopfia rhizophila CBS 207.26]KAF2175303.1 hypothetical protein K469DRAFT_702412 [Zopfia rhizophila CBS 207.26]